MDAGLENSIRNAVTPLVDRDHTLEMSFNVDGLPIYNSSNIEFWPILGLLHGFINVRPIVIGIAAGVGKPDLEMFLGDFANEFKKLLRDGRIGFACGTGIFVGWKHSFNTTFDTFPV